MLILLINANLELDKSVVSRDMAYLREKAQDDVKSHVQDKLPEEYQKCMVGNKPYLYL
jgi:hypothetical protein